MILIHHDSVSRDYFFIFLFFLFLLDYEKERINKDLVKQELQAMSEAEAAEIRDGLSEGQSQDDKSIAISVSISF